MKTRSIIFLFAIVCKANFAIAQDSTDYFINNLSWESLFIKPTYATELVLNKDAERLIAAKDQRTVNKLFCEISNEKKTVAIHMILSRMFEPQEIKFTQEYIYKADSIIAIKYIYNTLEWQYRIKESKYKIESETVKKIKEYWKKKLAPFLNKSTTRKKSNECSNAPKRRLL